ncbi:large subunit ribosomal protein L9 [Desulfonatronum thiosulfatophilum]|uniref:Large ribosomal subunit protein bL9 n=1 Tax=Desulfonatronum thiosulfatophilum TaxID=617002 RepID=A0A1G6EP64_9BACT|nr:50S ribosomal protein L9 [Desulfonatronum thiosulfatophilum]SDB59062.1 large subunit ribosomal protein L9 [Desulfonatronum thiosulfatophilum]
MEVILRTNLDNLGSLGQIVNVKPGYGRNYLIPQGLAMLATPGNKKRFEQERRKLQEKADAIRFSAQELADKISAVSLRIPVRVGEGDRLYGSVTSANIADLIKKDHGLDVDKKNILLDDSLRALGEYSIEVRVHQDIRAQLQVAVVSHDAFNGNQSSPEPVTDTIDENAATAEEARSEE